MCAKFQQLKKVNRLEKSVYERLYVNKATMPLFYGSIKIHKDNNPIRPTVACNDSPAHELAKFLSKL